MKKELKSLIHGIIYGFPGSLSGSILGYEVASKNIPEYTIRFIRDNSDAFRQLAYKINESVTVIIEKNPYYDAFCTGITTACGVTGTLLSAWELGKVERYVMNRRMKMPKAD